MVNGINKRLLVFNKFNGRCAYCGCRISLQNLQIDHIISRRSFKNKKLTMPREELDGLNNLNPSCGCCNSMKHDFSVEEFRSFLQQGVESLEIKNAKVRLAVRLGLIKVKKKDIVFYFEKVKTLNHG